MQLGDHAVKRSINGHPSKFLFGKHSLTFRELLDFQMSRVCCTRLIHQRTLFFQFKVGNRLTLIRNF